MAGLCAPSLSWPKITFSIKQCKPSFNPRKLSLKKLKITRRNREPINPSLPPINRTRPRKVLRRKPSLKPCKYCGSSAIVKPPKVSLLKRCQVSLKSGRKKVAQKIKNTKEWVKGFFERDDSEPMTNERRKRTIGLPFHFRREGMVLGVDEQGYSAYVEQAREDAQAMYEAVAARESLSRQAREAAIGNFDPDDERDFEDPPPRVW